MLRNRNAVGADTATQAGGPPDGHGEPIPETPQRGRESTAPADAPTGGLGPPGQRPLLVQFGIYAWALIGIVLACVLLVLVLDALRIVVVPLVLALFPAALLAPVMTFLLARRIPPALASLIAILGSLALITGVTGLLVPQIAEELPGLAESLMQGVAEVQAFLDRGPLGIDPARIDAVIEAAGEQAAAVAQAGALGVASAVAQGLVGLLFGVVALFFYLKDGARIAAWIRDLFPQAWRADAQVLGSRTWYTLGAYFRGQLVVALVDAIFIGLGVYLLGVPLALPIAVLVFFGGLFPIVGAFLSGAVAVLVALADGGFAIALAVLAVVVAVQQLESNLLAPVVLGRATALHPLGVIVALTAGGVLLGVLGAFLAVPIAASLTRAISYLRSRLAARHAIIGSAPAI